MEQPKILGIFRNPKSGAQVTDPTWDEIKARDLREVLESDTPVRLVIPCEMDRDLNNDRDIPESLRAAISFVCAELNIANNPIWTGSAPHIHEARFEQVILKNANEDLCSIMNHLRVTLEQRPFASLRVRRIVNGALCEDWIFRFESPIESVTAPSQPSQLVHAPVPPGASLFQVPPAWKAKGKPKKLHELEAGPLGALRLSAPPDAPVAKKDAADKEAKLVSRFVTLAIPHPGVSVLSVTPLYARRVNKLMPTCVRLVLASGVCNVKGIHPCFCMHLDVEETGVAHMCCSLCNEQTTVTLDRKSKGIFEFLNRFWSWPQWLTALNKTYTQLATGKIVERMINDRGELVFIERSSAEIMAYLRGHTFPVWSSEPAKKPVGRPSKKKKEEEVEEPPQEEWKLEPVFPAWLADLKRSRCKERIFNPELVSGVRGDFLNMYEGLGVEPKVPASGRLEDAAPLLRRHLREVICNKDVVAAEYLELCLAQLVRFPWIKLGVVFVLKAKQGAGKNTLLDVIRRFFGRHGVELSNARHVTGNFNQHLAHKTCIILNEAVWGGDKQSEGTLKANITESATLFEPKGVDAREGTNYWTFFISSNEKWCVPASPEVRRFVMLDVSNACIGKKEYFTELHNAINKGEEDREFLWYLQHRACSHPDQWKPALNMPPRTSALVDQMMQDRSQAMLRFLIEQLKEEGVWIYRPGCPIIQKGKTTKVRGTVVMDALSDASSTDPALRNQLGQQRSVATFFMEVLGPCFNNRERFLGCEKPQDMSVSDKCYWFDTAQNIMTHLSNEVLHVPGYFKEELEEAVIDGAKQKKSKRAKNP
jgi:hypothetical protein